MLAFIKKILFAAVLGLLVVFAYQNSEPFSHKLSFEINLGVEQLQYHTPEFPVVMLFAAFFALGMLTAGFHGVYERLARRSEMRKRDKRIRELEKTNEALRKDLAELRPPPGSAGAEGGAPGESAQDGRPGQVERLAPPEDDAPTL